MTQRAYLVQGVQGLCRGLCRGFPSCAGCAGSFSLSRGRGRVPLGQAHTHTPACIYIPCTPCTPCTRLIHIRYLRAHPAHHPAHPAQTRIARVNPLFLFLERKKMEETQVVTTRRIACTPANAPAMRSMVQQWPQLHMLVQHLQAQNVFPGLRGLSVTLTGDAAFVAGGIDTINQLNASKAV